MALLCVTIICYSDSRIENAKLNKKFEKICSEDVLNIIYLDTDKVQQMHLNRMSRSPNETRAETAYRIAVQLESNLTNSPNTSAVNKHALLVENFKRIWPVSQWREYGFFFDDYIDLINEHWLQFPPPSESLQKTLGGFYMLFTTLGCWGNVIVLLMYLR